MSDQIPIKTILVLGATGYVGGRLVPELLEQGFRVRVASRSLAKLKSRSWAGHSNVSLCEANVFDPQSLAAALEGCDTAYYFIHSMVPGQKSFEDADRIAAQNMVVAANQTSLKRIIYLGGLGDADCDLSKHLESRHEVERILRSSNASVTTLRAAMIIGSGSASFEILRYLVDRLPIMITPKWVHTNCQPIAIRNVIVYLVECLNQSQTIGETYDIGGADIWDYEALMRIYQEEAHLAKRWIIPVPVLTPRLSSYWIHLVTPIPAVIARPLAEGLCNEVVCRDLRIQELIPQKLLTCREAISNALGRQLNDAVLSSWKDSGVMPAYGLVYEGDPDWAGGTAYVDERKIIISASLESVWDVISAIGGARGWYHANFLWRLRGGIDRLLGGVGLRRGRRSAKKLVAGDALDFWRVLFVTPSERLLLVAEMKLPGIASLEFCLKPLSADQTELTLTARFKPLGLGGILYWYLVLPFHGYVFRGLLKGIAKRALD